MGNPDESMPVGCSACGAALVGSLAAGLCIQCLASRVGRTSAACESMAGGGVRLAAGFDLLETLGRGGMGVVYLAFERDLARYVALKQLGPAWQDVPKARERFIREARAAARLSHPGIVPILNVGGHDDPAWYTMEYVEGGDLTDLLLKRGGRLPWRDAVSLVAQVARAIQHAHAAGVAHRDLKPSNILLDASGAPKVADFGLAWIVGHEGRELTVTGEILGTPAYLAPEAISSGARDADLRRCDIYSLGALLFHLVSGRPPFTGDHPMEILGAIANQRAPRLADVAGAKRVPAALDRLCARCLEKRAEERFRSAAELADALAACAAGRLRWRPSLRIARRTYRRAATIIVVVATLACAAFLTAWVQRRGRVPVREAVPARRSATDPSAATPIIAVLPLEVMAQEDNTAILAAGLQDELVSTLTRISDLRVVATRSVRVSGVEAGDYVAARATLGVGAVLTGSVREDQDMLRISLQLIDTGNGTTLWSQGYTRRETLVFNLQTEIATAVALHLRARLHSEANTTRRGTTSSTPAAHNLFVRARALTTDASASQAQLLEAAKLLGEAIDLDPSFALALACLSMVHTQLYNWGDDRTGRRLELGLEAAQAALRVNADLAEAQVALGLYYHRGFRDYVTARPLIELAYELAPNSSEVVAALAHVERRQGDFAKAAVFFSRALELDPLNAILAYNTADTFLRLREFETASELLEKSLTRMPGHVALLKLRGDLHVAWKGDLAPMREEIRARDPRLPKPDLYVMDKIDWLILENRIPEALDVLRGSDLQTLEGQSVYFNRPGYEALLLDLGGRREEAREAAMHALTGLDSELRRRPNDARILLHAGQMHAILGELAEGERLVRRALTAGDLADVDAFDRGFYLRCLAIMQAQAGAHDQALATLRDVLREPNQTSVRYVALHPALLRYSAEFE